MSITYHWKTSEDVAFLFIILGILGLIQVILTQYAVYSLFIASPIVLILVPLGVVLAQASGTVVLTEVIASLRSEPRGQPRTAPAKPRRQYIRRFLIFMISALLVIAVWGLVFALWFLATPITQPAYLVKYILANTSGAIISLVFVILVDWLFKR